MEIPIADIINNTAMTEHNFLLFLHQAFNAYMALDKDR